MQETPVWCLNREDPLEEGTATYCSILAWRIPWTEEPGWLQSLGLQKVGYDWATKHSTASSLSSTFWDGETDVPGVSLLEGVHAQLCLTCYNPMDCSLQRTWSLAHRKCLIQANYNAKLSSKNFYDVIIQYDHRNFMYKFKYSDFYI